MALNLFVIIVYILICLSSSFRGKKVSFPIFYPKETIYSHSLSPIKYLFPFFYPETYLANNNNKLPTVDFQLIFVKYNGNSLSWSQPSLVCLSRAIWSSEATQGVMFSYASSVPWNQQLRLSQTQETPKRFSNNGCKTERFWSISWQRGLLNNGRGNIKCYSEYKESCRGLCIHLTCSRKMWILK